MTALFVIGYGGNQNPYPRQTRELAQQHGRTLANSVEAALDAQCKPLDGPLRTALETTSLSFAKGPSRAELRQQAKSRNAALQRHARRLLRQLDEGDGFIKQYAYPVQVVQFGDGLTLVGLAGETVVDYSLRLKRELAGPIVWVAGYCNALPTYIHTYPACECSEKAVTRVAITGVTQTSPHHLTSRSSGGSSTKCIN